MSIYSGDETAQCSTTRMAILTTRELLSGCATDSLSLTVHDEYQSGRRTAKSVDAIGANILSELVKLKENELQERSSDS